MGAGQAPHGMGMAMFLAIGFGVSEHFFQYDQPMHDGRKRQQRLVDVSSGDAIGCHDCQDACDDGYSDSGNGVDYRCRSFAVGGTFHVGQPVIALDVGCPRSALSLGLGLVLSSLAVFVPALDKVVPMILRILFFVSGIFFSISIFSQSLSEYLLWNPVMHAVELCREAMHAPYVVPGVSLSYLCFIALTMCALGGFLERYVRSRRMDQ